MKIRDVYRWFVSARATVALLLVLAVLLLLNVALPQASVVGEERFDELASASRWAHFVLVSLGFGRMPTSPVFLTALGLFFLNLALVLALRVGPTFRRTAIRPRSESGLDRWARVERKHAAPLPEGWDVAAAARALRGHGYLVQRPGEHSLFGVKHRGAPLGFLLFHVSFFLLCAGGVALYYTRFEGSVVLTEGQLFEGRFSEIERVPPAGPPTGPRFRLVEVEPRFESGEPVHLGATLRIDRAGSPVDLVSRVNHPPRWGASTLLVNEAGLSPVFWVQDRDGYTIDRVAVPVRTMSGQPTEAPLGESIEVVVFPLRPETPFPDRAGLRSTSLRVVFLDDGRTAFEGTLLPGDGVELATGRIVLEEIRYWARVRVIRERGGGVLISGFVLGIAGLVWRLVLHRREIAVTWDEIELRLVGRSEYFTRRFDDELATVRETLTGASPSARIEPTAPASGRA